MIFALLILVSCTQDVNEISQSETEGVPVPISYTITPMKVVGDAALATKATDPATVDENQISNLWIVQYNKTTGAFIKRYYTENVDKNAFIAHLSPTLSGNCNVYFVANAGASLPVAYTNNDFVNLTKDLTNEASMFVDGKVVSGASKLNIIMTGFLLNINIPVTGVMPTQNVKLDRLLARVDVKYTITTDLDNKFVFESIKLGNVPTKMYYNSQGSPGATATTTSMVKSFDAVALTADQKSVGAHTITFYVPDNKRGAGNNTALTDATLKGGIPDATFIEMVGHTKGAQGGEEVGYRLYPGLDIYNDYNIVGNIKYLLELTFAGTSLMDQRVKMHDANCWMLKPGGTCNISVVRANRSDLGIQIPDVTKNWTAEVYWQTTPDMVSVDYTSTLSLGYFKVTAAAGKVGNALVVVKDANGKIVWSWHIWVLNDDMNLKTYQQNYNSGVTFMDRNLGATQTTTYNNNVSYEFIGGMMYQWGRKDPFIGTKSMATNPAPLKLYKATGTTEFAPPAYSDVPGGVATLTGDPYIRNSQSIPLASKLDYSVRYPSLFINSWYGSTAIDATTYAGRDSWGGEYNQPKTIYDPCPEGWRVPSAKRTSTSLVHPWSGVSGYATPSGTAADGSMGYISTNGTPNVVAAYPVMGLRGSTGNFNSQTVAYVFSATAFNNVDAIFYYHSSGGTSTSTSSGLGKYYAGSIRCVKDWKLTY